jgi:RNA polymerase sigma-70 factor (ECF subfamily)
VQETFVRVLAKPRTISGDDELHYLMRVLRNTYFTSRRTASRRPVTVAAIDEVTLADARRTGQPAFALEITEIYEAIAALPEDFRLALVAVDLLGLSYREAAKALRVREATVTTRLYRARRRLASTLGDTAPAPQGDGAAGDKAEPNSSADGAQPSSNGLATPARREDSSRQESLLRRNV